MIKFFIFIFLSFGLYSFAELDRKKEQTEELYTFTAHIFHMLKESGEQENIERSLAKLDSYKKDESHPEIARLAAQFSDSLRKKDSQSKEKLTEAVSSLGRHLKCSVANNSYRIEKKALQKELSDMEKALGKRCPKASNDEYYHELMMGSLVSEQYDLALYAYLKIAEGRCAS